MNQSDVNKNKFDSLGVYIHIPFCMRKCPYCGFLSSPVNDEREIFTYKNRLIDEIELFGREAGEYISERKVDSIFFGGGTPSLMPPQYIDEIISKVRELFNVSADCEITMESNPGMFNDAILPATSTIGNTPANLDCIGCRKSQEGAARLRQYRDAGVNRLSIGIQSFDDEVLRTLGRIHNSEEGEEAFILAREDGFDNINLDLMFGIPGQTISQWTHTLKKAISLNPEHISFYSLQIEEGTAYYDSFMNGDFNELPDDVDRDMYHAAIRELTLSGYRHYEISNAAKPGFECRHNLKYWEGKEYVGFGDSAASYIAARALPNLDISNQDKVDYKLLCGDDDRIGSGKDDRLGDEREMMVRYIMMHGEKKDIHVNSLFDDMSEYVFTSLRLRSGLNFGVFKSRFGVDLKDAFSDRWEALDEFFKSGSLKIFLSNDGEPASLAITEKGIDISNRIMAIFV